ncbi:MAG: fibronectin type III domain-containing protein [Candidatus Moraniibacteriota bacterium]
MTSDQIANPLENTHEKRSKKLLKLFLLQVLVVFGGIIFFQMRNATEEGGAAILDAPVVGSGEEGVVLADTAENTPEADHAVAKSENFRMGQIVFAGESDFLLDETDQGPPKIDGVQGQIVSKKGKKEMQLVIIWKTNKPTSGEVIYGKNRSDNGKKITEDTYGTNHGVVIPNLSQGTTYLYTIHAKDRFGNDTKSDTYAMFTGAEQLSLIDLIANAARDTFSWAVK